MGCFFGTLMRTSISGAEEVGFESNRKMLERAADTGYSMWHNA